MRAFWWYKENSIAGMGRPGFNRVQWLDMPFNEGCVMGWMGKFSSGAADLATFRHHIQDYAPKIFKFHGMDEKSGPEAMRVFETPKGFSQVLERLIERTHFLENYSVVGNTLNFQISKARLMYEADLLRQRNVSRIVCLTEVHHDADFLGEHFELHHIGVEDLHPPNAKQVEELAEIIAAAKSNGEALAVHCLAGIGRTSTMLVAAHLLMGENHDELMSHVTKRNPQFALTKVQSDFLQSLAAESA